MHVRPLVVGLLAAGAVLGLTGASASAASIPHSVLYTSTAPGVGNIPSVGVEAYSFNQIGDEVMLRRVAKIKSVAVQLSSWACQTGAWNTGDCHTNAGATFTIPYRPSASSHCTGAQAGEWFKNGQGCFNGLAHTIGFTLTGLKTKLPKDVAAQVSTIEACMRSKVCPLLTSFSPWQVKQ